MTQIIVNHCGKTSNVDAMQACLGFIITNYANRRFEGYMHEREITLKNGQVLEVSEAEHPRQDESPCSVIFNVKKV